MPGLTNDNIPMSARVREFDPTGDIVRVAASIATLIADRIDEVGDAALDAFIERNPGVTYSTQQIDSLRAGARTYYRDLLSDLAGETWAHEARSFLRAALSNGYSVRSQIVVVNRAVDQIRQLICDAVADHEERAVLMTAMRGVLLVNVELICAIYADVIREQDQIGRERQRRDFFRSHDRPDRQGRHARRASARPGPRSQHRHARHARQGQRSRPPPPNSPPSPCAKRRTLRRA